MTKENGKQINNRKQIEDSGRISSNVMDLIGIGYNDTRYATDKYDLHCHNFYEIYYFLEGDADYLVEGQRYELTSDSLLLLSPGVFHGVRIRSEKNYRRYAMHFHPDILSMERRGILLSVFPSYKKHPNQKIYFEHMEKFHLEAELQALCEYAECPARIREQLVPIGVEAVLGRILSVQKQGSKVLEQQMSNDLVMEILIYLNRHMDQEITLDSLAERFLISKQYLNRVFRRAVGTTIIDYLLRKRIIYAQQLLVNGCSAAEASLKAGFRDYSSFYRAYRKILGHSPLNDRGVLPSVKGIYAHHSQESIKVGPY